MTLKDFVMNYARRADYVLLESYEDENEDDLEELDLVLGESYAFDYWEEGYKHAEDLHLDDRKVARVDVACDSDALPVLVIILK